MSSTIKLISIPKEGTLLLEKALSRGSLDEYSSVFFSLIRAFEDDFCTYAHKDWIEFKKDAEQLKRYYPNKDFELKFQYDTLSRYEIMEYLMARYENKSILENKRIELSFFKGNHICESQGRNFEFWDYERMRDKLNYIESIDKIELMSNYNPEILKEAGIYQAERGKNERKLILTQFEELEIFLTESNKLKGYTIILNH